MKLLDPNATYPHRIEYLRDVYDFQLRLPARPVREVFHNLVVARTMRNELTEESLAVSTALTEAAHAVFAAAVVGVTVSGGDDPELVLDGSTPERAARFVDQAEATLKYLVAVIIFEGGLLRPEEKKDSA
jgi:hypothetical protein